MERKIYRYGEEPEDVREIHSGDIIEKDYVITTNGEDIIDLPMGIYALIDSVDYQQNDYLWHIVLNTNENTEAEQLAGLLREIGLTDDVDVKKVLKKLLDLHFSRDTQINFLIDFMREKKDDEEEKAFLKKILDYIGKP